MKVQDMMTKSPVTTSPETPLLDAAEAMLSANVSALPVMNGDRLVGLITEGDLLRRWEAGTDQRYQGFAVVKVGIDRMASDYVRSHGGYVRELMTTDVVSIDEDTSVEDAIRLFENRGIKQLPVTRDGKLIGIMTRKNVLESYVENARRMREGVHSDEDIKRALYAIYTQEPWAPLDRIDLYVKGGVVEITGSVEKESQRRAVVAAAEGVPGVKRVLDSMDDCSKAEAMPRPKAS